MVLFYELWKNYNEIKLTKNKMNLYNRKMTIHPPSPERLLYALYNNAHRIVKYANTSFTQKLAD